MNAVFADTSYYVAIASPLDVSHEKAIEMSHRLHVRVITTQYILVELSGFLARGPDRARFLEMVTGLRSNPQVMVVPSSTDLFDRALDLFARRPDKDWSLTDCISFVVMQQHGLSEALTADRHFEQAGFKALLLEPAL